jgi:apolipoprotein N-acyltransferase
LLAYLIDKHVVKKGVKFYSTLIFPSAVVSVEYVLSLLIGIWGNGAIAQFHNSNLIQISSVFGVFGISFLIAWFGSTLNWVVENGIKSKRLWTGLVIYGTVLISVLLFGVIRQKSLPEAEDTVKVATIVGITDIQQVYEDWEENIIGLSKNYAQEIPAEIYSDSSDMEAMINRTDKALSNGAKIVVWNEISLLLMPSQTGSLVEKVKDLCAKYQAFVLIAMLEKNAGDLPKPFNNISILVDPECQILWKYQKYYLSHERLVTNTGSGPIPFADTEYGRIANTICADLDFSAYISQVGKESIDILHNKSLKPTATHVTPFAEKAKPAPRYGGLVPPLGPTLRAALTAGDCTHPLVSLRERSLTIAWSRPECRQASLTPDWRLSRRPF